MKAALTTVVALAVVLGCQARLQVPAGFRCPSGSDHSGSWELFRAQLPVPFHVTADLTGDNVLDEAWLLPKTSGPGV
jgi:hypothetical protein